MKVFVNDQEVTLGPGMTVKHALTAAGLVNEVEKEKRSMTRWERDWSGWGVNGRGEDLRGK